MQLFKGFSMSKNILILSTTNDSVSIIAESILTKYIPAFNIFSAGIKPAQVVNKEIQKALIKENSWQEDFSPKNIDSLSHISFDMVIVLSNFAATNCPDFNEDTIIIQIDYDEPDYKNSTKLERLIKSIKMELIPITRNQFA